jgi:DNA-binding NtrC family response regulator
MQCVPQPNVDTKNSDSTQTLPEPLILFVDDNEDIRTLMQTCLEFQHFAVVTAANGSEGLQVFKNNGAIRVIVTDEDMPLMTGEAMIREVRQINPKMKIIRTSANIRDGVQSDTAITISLCKPYMSDELAHAVRQLLGVSQSKRDGSRGIGTESINGTMNRQRKRSKKMGRISARGADWKCPN